MLPIAVDAMGGDRAPGEIVAGAPAGSCSWASRWCSSAAGRLDGRGDLDLSTASEVIAMDDDPARASARKKDSSLVRAAEAVRDGKAIGHGVGRQHRRDHGRALLRMGRIKGVARPAIATPIPVPGAHARPSCSTPGANAECQPEWLVQFAPDGRGLRPRALRHRRRRGRPAVDRRGAQQGQRRW